MGECVCSLQVYCKACSTFVQFVPRLLHQKLDKDLTLREHTLVVKPQFDTVTNLVLYLKHLQKHTIDHVLNAIIT